MMATGSNLRWLTPDHGEPALDHDGLLSRTLASADGCGQFEELSSQLVTVPEAAHRRAVAVLSPDAGDGRSYVAMNLAVNLASSGQRTLLVDADMDRPSLHNSFGIDPVAGLGWLLAGDRSVEPFRIASLPGLYFLPRGELSANAGLLLRGRGLERILHDFLVQFEQVVIDTSPGSFGSAGVQVAAAAGSCIVVGRKGRSSLASLRSLLERLNRRRTEVLGVIVNTH